MERGSFYLKLNFFTMTSVLRMLTNEGKKRKFGAGALLCYGWAHAACSSCNSAK
jgi:hypothetical protein